MDAKDEQYDIRIARDGTWYYQGSAIQRPGLVRLFASVLQRDEAGDYWLITPAERGRIMVEDVPFVAVAMAVAGQGAAQNLTFRTNLDESITAGAYHPIHLQGDIPYVMVRGGMAARIGRAVYYDLAALAVAAPDSSMLGVWSGGVFFPLGNPS